MYKHFLVFLFFSLISGSLFSQDNVLDSLKHLLKTSKSDTTKINLLNQLSVQISSSDSLQSLRYAKNALSQAKRINYFSGIAEAYFNIGLFYELVYNQKLAEGYYRKVIALSLKNDMPKQLAAGYQNYAILQKLQANFKEALKLNLLAIPIYERLKDSIMLANVYTNTGNCYVNLNLFKDAIAYHIKSLKLNQKLNAHLGEARAYNNIAIVYERNGDFHKALENYRLALKSALKSRKKPIIAAINGNIGSSYQDLKQPMLALPYVKEAISYFKEIGDKQRLGLNLNNLATIYNDLKKYKLAYDASNDAIEVANEANDQESLGYAYITAATAMAGLNNYTAAQNMISKALIVARQQNRAALYLDLYGTGAKIYKSAGKHEKANEFFEKVISLKDSTYNAEKHSQIASLQEQYESQRKDKLIIEKELAENISKSELNRNKRLLIVLILAISGLIIIVVLIIRNIRLLGIKSQTEKALLSSEAKEELLNEKLRISSELHDNIGSQLTFIHSSIQNLRSSNQSPGDLMLKETEDIAVNTIRDLRQTVWFINNSSFSSDDFAVRLHEYLKPYQALSNTKVSIENSIPQNFQLSSFTATHLFRIVQEAITNAIKYAEASCIEIKLFQLNDKGLAIRITDNGKGFDVSESSAGFGLKNMKSRAEKLDADFSIESSENSGTSIQVRLPQLQAVEV
jgi:signal transduction histidine kinase